MRKERKKIIRNNNSSYESKYETADDHRTNRKKEY